jgi:hypothetical protein
MSLDPDAAEHDLPLRKGRAIGWIEEALRPLHGRLSPKELRRLVLAVRSATGIEARVWLTDIAGLSSQETTELADGQLRPSIDPLSMKRRPDANELLGGRIDNDREAMCSERTSSYRRGGVGLHSDVKTRLEPADHPLRSPNRMAA